MSLKRGLAFTGSKLNSGVASFGKKLDWYGLVEKLDIAEGRAYSREELIEPDEFKVGRAARSSEENLSLRCETFQRTESKEKDGKIHTLLLSCSRPWPR
jgi:hypothetical protein